MRELSVFHEHHRPWHAHEGVVLHPQEVMRDERENVHIGFQVIGVAPVPEVRLVDAVSHLSHVERLQLRIERGQRVAERVLIPNLLAESDRIPRANHSARARVALWNDVLRVSKASFVRAKVRAGAVHVFDVEVGHTHPAELCIVLGVPLGRPLNVVGQLPQEQYVARHAFDQHEQGEQ